jgi:integrase
MKNKKIWSKTKHTYLYRLNSDRYYARIKVNGKYTFKSLKTDKLEIAKNKLRELINQVESGRKVADKESQGRTLGALINDMIERTENSLHLKPNSIKFEKRCLNYIIRHWHQDAHTQKLKDISKNDLYAFFKYMRTNYATSSFNRCKGIFGNIIEEAEKFGIHIEDIKDIKRVPDVVRKVKLPNDEMFQKWLNEMKKEKGGLERDHYVRLLAYTGMRPDSEAYQVTWADVDFDNEILHIKGDPETGTKNDRHKQSAKDEGKGRELPMNANLKELLLEIKATYPDAKPTDKVVTVKSPRKAMENAARRLGMEPLTRSDLRKYFTTKCLNAGIDVATVADWRGDTEDCRTLLKHYAMKLEGHQKAMAAKVSF